MSECVCGHEFIRYICYNCGSVEGDVPNIIIVPDRLIHDSYYPRTRVINGQVTKRKRIYERDGNKCLRCKSTTHLTLDHVIPKCKGGTAAENNLQTLCYDCNQWKGSRTIDYRVYELTSSSEVEHRTDTA